MLDLIQAVKSWCVENEWTFYGKKWKNGRKLKTTDELVAEYLMDDFEDNSKKELINALTESSKIVESEGADNTEELTRANLEWSYAYKRLCNARWSSIDDMIWDGMYYTLDHNGEKMIVARISPNSKEVRIIGKTEDEIANSMAGIFVDNDMKISRHSYIDDMLTNCIINECTARLPGWTTPIDKISPDNLPSSVANILYCALPKMGEGDVQLGWTLNLNKSTSYYPTVKSYIKHSMSAFLAQESKYIDNISTVSNDKDTYTYTYINLEKYVEGATNIWDTWGRHSFNNKGEYECFCTWVGSIFVAKNTSKQVCWLQGVGNMGLSKVQNSIYKELGKYSVASFTGPNALEGAFVNANVVGKRLAVISDSKNENHIRKGVVHNWTGGDVALINQKNKQAYSMAIYMKVMICENIAPAINFEQDNQMSRVLYFKMKVRSNDEKVKMGIGRYDADGSFVEMGSGDFQGELDSQVNAWIYKCIQLYYANCPNNAQIAPYKGHQDQIIARCADRASELLYDWLIDNVEISADDVLYQSELLDRIKIPNFNADNGYSLQSLNLMMEKYYQVSASKDTGKKRYIGVRLKPNDPIEPAKRNSAYESLLSVSKHAILDADEIDASFMENM